MLLQAWPACCLVWLLAVKSFLNLHPLRISIAPSQGAVRSSSSNRVQMWEENVRPYFWPFRLLQPDGTGLNPANANVGSFLARGLRFQKMFCVTCYMSLVNQKNAGFQTHSLSSNFAVEGHSAHIRLLVIRGDNQRKCTIHLSVLVFVLLLASYLPGL